MLTTIMTGLLLAAAPAQQTPDTTFNVDARGRVQIEDLRGDLQINTWDRPQMRVRVDPDEAGRLRIDAGSPTVRVGFDRLRGAQGGDLSLTIPTTMAVRVTGTHGDVEIKGVEADVAVEVVTGDVELTGGRGVVSIRTVQGDIEAHQVQGRMDFHTTNGDLQASNLSGDLVAESISGDVALHDVDAGSAQVTSVSGDVTYAGAVRDRGVYTLKAHSGDLTFIAAPAMNATISVSTFSGEFATDVPVQLNEQRAGKQFSFTLGSGSAHVDLESFSGDIRLEREGAPAQDKEKEKAKH